MAAALPLAGSEGKKRSQPNKTTLRAAEPLAPSLIHALPGLPLAGSHARAGSSRLLCPGRDLQGGFC